MKKFITIVTLALGLTAIGAIVNIVSTDLPSGQTIVERSAPVYDDRVVVSDNLLGDISIYEDFTFDIPRVVILDTSADILDGVDVYLGNMDPHVYPIMIQ